MSPCLSILRKLAKKPKLTLQKSFITLSRRVLLLAAKWGTTTFVLGQCPQNKSPLYLPWLLLFQGFD
jgi:hypothetical protein